MHIYHIKRTSKKRTTSLVAIPVYKKRNKHDEITKKIILAMRLCYVFKLHKTFSVCSLHREQ